MEGVIPPLYPARDTMGLGLQIATADSHGTGGRQVEESRERGDRPRPTEPEPLSRTSLVHFAYHILHIRYQYAV